LIQTELAWLREHNELLHTRLRLGALTGNLSVNSLQAINAQLAPSTQCVNLEKMP
jgi:outer membrane protein